jgi:peptide/nickel transport system substrate-binding protein
LGHISGTAQFRAAPCQQSSEKTIARRLNRLAVDHVLYAPLGVMLQHHAWRKNVSGIVQAPLSVFWGVSKTA